MLQIPPSSFHYLINCAFQFKRLMTQHIDSVFVGFELSRNVLLSAVERSAESLTISLMLTTRCSSVYVVVTLTVIAVCGEILS